MFYRKNAEPSRCVKPDVRFKVVRTHRSKETALTICEGYTQNTNKVDLEDAFIITRDSDVLQQHNTEFHRDN